MAADRLGARRRTGPTTFGMMSPPFSIDDDVALADVAAGDFLLVVQRGHLTRSCRSAAPARARRTASRAPVRPTLTSILRSRGRACSAGNLNATAQRGNFAVVPEPSPQRQVVELDDDAVGLERRAMRRSSRHSLAERDHARRCRRTGASAARPDIPTPAAVAGRRRAYGRGHVVPPAA